MTLKVMIDQAMANKAKLERAALMVKIAMEMLMIKRDQAVMMDNLDWTAVMTQKKQKTLV